MQTNEMTNRILICVFLNFLQVEMFKFACLKMLAMKSIGRNLLNGFQLNPINRDLLIVISSGLLIAVAIITLLVMIVSQI